MVHSAGSSYVRRSSRAFPPYRRSPSRRRRPIRTRFEAEIQKFDESDRATPVRPGGVVFTGSSSIRLWTGLAEDFPGVRTLNRGFGGSEIGDAIRYLDRVVLRYKPSQVVFYSGDNDLNAGKTPTAVAADYRRFVEAIHAQLPQTRIVDPLDQAEPGALGARGQDEGGQQIGAADGCATAGVPDVRRRLHAHARR